MPNIPKSGTAWAKCLDEYAYTRDHDKSGWGWEFLRRNRRFADDFESRQQQSPTETYQQNGIDCIVIGQRDDQAEKWNLLTFSTLKLNTERPHLFWKSALLPHLIRYKSCDRAADHESNFNLHSIAGRKSLLRLDGSEYIVIQRHKVSIRLAGQGCSLASGPCKLTFEIEDLADLNPQFTALKMLARFISNQDETCLANGQNYEKLLTYLVALDGHLEGQSYRQIAQVLYGAERVAELWDSESRFMKDKIRRAVERGIALMEGEYVTLLQ
jgi:hypothetical protein